jgi:hypothetical protein
VPFVANPFCALLRNLCWKRKIGHKEHKEHKEHKNAVIQELDATLLASHT